MYVLTPKGVEEKIKLTANFMKRIMKEYDDLQKELKKNKKWTNLEFLYLSF